MNLSDFDQEDAPLYNRLMAAYASKVVAIFGGLQLLLMMDWSLSGHAFWRALWLCIGSSIIAGVLFALFMHVTTVPSTRRRTRERLTRIFASDAAIVPPPPGDATHRLICGLIYGRSRAVGAILYVRPSGLRVQLNYPSRRWWERAELTAPQPLEIDPPNAITLEHGTWLQAWWQRILVRHEPTALLIRWPDGAIALRVPNSLDTLAKLQACIDELRSLANHPPDKGLTC